MNKKLLLLVFLTTLPCSNSQAAFHGPQELALQVGHVMHHRDFESDLGLGGGINLFNFDEVLGLYFNVQYQGADASRHDYADLDLKGHIRQKFPIGGIIPYLGFGWLRHKYWYTGRGTYEYN
jgi:hypothetical protein